MNDLFGLITFWSFVIAAYSIFPPKTRAKVKLFVSMDFTLGILILSSAFAIFINLTYIFSFCSEADVCRKLYALNPVITYMILAIYAFVALWEINKSKVNRGNIKRFKDSAEILYRKGLAVKEDPEGWSVLIDILHDNTDNLFEIASKNELLRRLWYGFWIKIMPQDRIIFGFLPEKGKKSKRKKSVYKDLLRRLFYSKILIEVRRKISRFATLNKVNTFYPSIPSSKATETARLIIENYLLDKNLLELSTDYKPDYILSILKETINSKYKVEEIIEKCLIPLLSNEGSILFREIYDFNVPDRVGTNNVAGSQLLSILFDQKKVDKDFINETHIYGAILQFMYDHLKSFRNKRSDPYNDAEKDVYPPSSYYNPILVSIQLYDWIVITALELGVEWHMWLMRLADWTKSIVRNMSFSGENWKDTREFPTIYFFALYQIIDKLTGWLDFVEESSTIKVKSIQGMVDKNGNISQNIIETIALYLKYVSNSEMTEHYKVYLGDIIWRKYFELLNSKRKELKPYGELLLKQMVEKLTLYGADFDFKQFKMMNASLYRFDVVGLHSSDGFKQSDFAKKELIKISKSEILPYLAYDNNYKTLEENSKKYLSDTATVRSDGVYVQSYFRDEKIFTLKDLGIIEIKYS